jgi:hypothetical protein
VVRSDVVDRFAQFGAVLGMLENFGPDIGEPQAARRTFEQADPELVLEVGNARAATAAEIAANFAVRQEFKARSKSEGDFVNSLLRGANGLDGKLNRLLLPMTDRGKANKILSGVKKDAERVNKKRNAVAHQGEFCNVGESQQAIESARKFIEAVVGIYEPGFTLKDKS